jgi:hypothetical protein
MAGPTADLLPRQIVRHAERATSGRVLGIVTTFDAIRFTQGLPLAKDAAGGRGTSSLTDPGAKPTPAP